MRLLACLVFCCVLGGSHAQQSSRNVHVAGHFAVDDGAIAVHLDQDASRPVAYALTSTGNGVVLDVSDPANPIEVARIDGPAAADLAMFRSGERHYLIAGGQTVAVYDVSVATEPNTVYSFQSPEAANRLFAYRHSGGVSLLWVAGPTRLLVYRLEPTLTGDAEPALILESPEHPGPERGFSDVFVGFDPASQSDRVYAAAGGGYYVYDVTDLADPSLVHHVRSAAVQNGRAVAPTPDGAYLLTLADYRTAPMRLFDLTDGPVMTAAGAWLHNWDNELADVMVRWPFAFVSALEAGLHVVNIFDVQSPYTDAWFRTVDPSAAPVAPLARSPEGIVRVDVRNHDGLIAAADRNRGIWLLRIDAFSQWSGNSWGLPDVSEVQDWDYGLDSQN